VNSSVRRVRVAGRTRPAFGHTFGKGGQPGDEAVRTATRDGPEPPAPAAVADGADGAGARVPGDAGGAVTA
jgi:hypothetical protein